MELNLFAKALFVFFIVLSATMVCGEIENVLAEINKNGFTESLLFEVVKSNKKSSHKDLIKQLESPKVQKLLISNALKYASSEMGDEVKKTMKLKRNSWSNYCAYSWVRWLSFMNCDNNVSTSELDREENQNFQVMKDDGKCYRKPEVDYW